MTAEKLASLPERKRTTRTVDALRQVVRTRAEPVELKITEPHANHVQHTNSSEVSPRDYFEEPRRDPASVQPSAAPEKSRIRPSASDQIAEAKQRAAGPGTKTPRSHADQDMPRRHRKLSEAERNGLIASLEKRPLPLQEVVVREGGRERTIYELVPDKALSDDAELVAQAVEQQRDALFQELFRRRFEQLLEAVRAASMAAPIASAADRRAMVNPTRDPGLAVALTAAEGSPSFDAAMFLVTAPSLEEEHGLVEQQLARNQRGGRH